MAAAGTMKSSASSAIRKICTWNLILLTLSFILSDPVFANKHKVNYFDSANSKNNMILKENAIISANEIGKLEKSPSTQPSHGGSRFDVGGILTTFGMKQGASIFALVLFPILLPLMILLGLALFIISLFGSGGLAVGRRSDIGNSNGATSGYASLLRDGLSSISLTNRDGLALNAVENEACIEKFVCEVLLHYGGSKIIGKKTTMEILRELNVKPVLISGPFPGRKSRKVWKCLGLKCNWEQWIPWIEGG